MFLYVLYSVCWPLLVPSTLKQKSKSKAYVHEIQTVYNVVQNPQMVLLSEKGAHGAMASARCEKACMLTTLLPPRRMGNTLENHMLFIANGTTVASQANLVTLSTAHNSLFLSCQILNKKMGVTLAAKCCVNIR